MAVTRIEITSHRPYAGGQSFGEVGPYEDLQGTIHFAVDPEHAANRAIVDLDKALQDANGRVTFKSDFRLFRPADASRANRSLLFEVVNRGRQRMPFSMTPAEPEPTNNAHPGDGFLMRRGWTVAWCGWEWDIIDDPALIGLDAPQALGLDGHPIQGEILVQFQPNEPHPYQHLSHDSLHPRPGLSRFFQRRPYPAADVDDQSARMTVREREYGERREIPRAKWRFAREQGGRVETDDSYVWIEGGFRPGLIYEVIYRTRICPVVGAGFLAVRDCISFLRHGTAGNPAPGLIEHTFGYGQSQCGRFLRHFLSHAMNVDEEGRRVFDGLIPHVAGARRGEFNHRYAQPSAQHVLSFGHLPPFHDLPQHDPVTGAEYPGLLDAQERAGGVPKIFHTNTSSEYWRSEASLCHSDTAATRDVDPGDAARIYLLAGTEHGAGLVPPAAVDPKGARTANTRNTVHYGPPLRALFVALEEWVTRGVEPPPSVVPRLADDSAASREAVLEWFSRLPGAALLDADQVPVLRRIDLGPRAGEGIAQLPAKTGERYPCFVSAVDDDGNEVAGIRLPDLTVPLGSHTGWNPRHPDMGAPGQNVDMYGSTLPFPRTKAERERRRDPRLSIEERYADRAEYLDGVRAAAVTLVRERFLVEEDVELVLKHAAERWAYFTSDGLSSRA